MPVPFGQAFFFRYFVAGLIVSLASIPLFPSITIINLSVLGAYLIGVLTVGLFLRGLTIFFWDLLVGQWMPSFLRRRLIERLQQRLREALETLSATRTATDITPASIALDDRWWRALSAQAFVKNLPHFPDPDHHNALRPTILAPTMFGNIAMAFGLDMDRHFASGTSPLLGQQISPVVQASWTLPPTVRQELQEAIAPGEGAFCTATGMIILVICYAVAAVYGWWHPLAHRAGSVIMVVVTGAVAYWASAIGTREYAGAYDAIRTLVTAGLMSSSLVVQRDAALRSATEVAQRWSFEKIWNVIYRSQIEILEHLSMSGDGTAFWNDLMERFYRPLVERHPEFASYRFSDYMGFLLRVGLVTYDTSGADANPRVGITPLGRNFLAYMVSQGYTKDLRGY